MDVDGEKRGREWGGRGGGQLARRGRRREEEEKESEKEEKEEATHSKKQAKVAPKKRIREEEHSHDAPNDNPVLAEKGFSAKGAQSTMVEVKQEPQAIADKKKRKAEEHRPPNVPPQKSDVEGGTTVIWRQCKESWRRNAT